MPNNTTSHTFISSQDAAELANVSLKTIRNWRNKNHFSWHQENDKGTKSKILIDKASFQEYLQRMKEQTTEESNGTSHQVPLSPITSPIAPPITSNDKSHQVPLETELLLIKQKVKHLEENLQKSQDVLAGSLACNNGMHAGGSRSGATMLPYSPRLLQTSILYYYILNYKST